MVDDLIARHAAVDATAAAPPITREAESVREQAAGLVQRHAERLGMDAYAVGLIIDLIRKIEP